MAENDTIQSQDEVVATLSHVDDYLKIGQEYDCSDIHLATNAKPTWRRYGTLQSIWENGATLTAADTERLAFGFLGEKEKARLGRMSYLKKESLRPTFGEMVKKRYNKKKSYNPT